MSVIFMRVKLNVIGQYAWHSFDLVFSLPSFESYFHCPRSNFTLFHDDVTARRLLFTNITIPLSTLNTQTSCNQLIILYYIWIIAKFVCAHKPPIANTIAPLSVYHFYCCLFNVFFTRPKQYYYNVNTIDV